MKKRHDIYTKENFIDAIYSLVNAFNGAREVPNKNKIRELIPLSDCYSGYIINKIEFKDPRNGVTYKDKWKRTNIDDEVDRLKKIRGMNKKIQEYNKFAKEHEDGLGKEKIEYQKYFQQFEYPEWSLMLYLSTPTLRKVDEIIPTRMINNKWLYQKATKIPKNEFIRRCNKTLYDWIIDMLPQSFNDSDNKFLSDKHILFEPKLEFENWFMTSGLIINDSLSLFDDFEEEKKEGLSELEILRNTDIVKTKKIKELRHQLRLMKEPFRDKVRKMINEGILDDFIDKNCRKKNGKINWAELGRQLECHADTAKKMMLETGMNYLFDDSKNTYVV